MRVELVVVMKVVVVVEVALVVEVEVVEMEVVGGLKL